MRKPVQGEACCPVHVHVAVPAFVLKYRGSADLFDGLLRPLLAPMARGEAVPGTVSPRRPLRGAAPEAYPQGGLPERLWGDLARRGARSALRDAALCALVELSGPAGVAVSLGRIAEYLASRGMEGTLRLKPVFAKLRDRRRLVLDGTAPGTWQPTEAGRERVQALAASMAVPAAGGAA